MYDLLNYGSRDDVDFVSLGCPHYNLEQLRKVAGLLEGVQMVVKQFYTVLDKHHIAPIESVGAAFDPHVHEAMMQQPSTEQPPNTVLYEVRPGFQLYDRVVRPAQVVVSASPAQSDGRPQATS